MVNPLIFKFKYFLQLAFVCLLFNSCNDQATFDKTGNIYVPEKMDKEEYLASDLFASVKYTPLEKTKLSNLSNIDKFIHHKSFFIVFCSKANNVFVFNENSGHFLNNMHLPENKTIEIGSFAFDYNKEIVIISDLKSLEFHFFELTGRFIRSISNSHLNFKDFEYLDNGFIFLMSYSDKQDKSTGEDYKVLITDINLKPVRRYIKYNKSSIYNHDIYDNSQSFFRSSDNQSVRLTIPGDYTIYHFVDANSYSTQIIYPPKKDQLPNDFLSNNEFNGDRIKFINRNKNKIYSFQDIYFVNENIKTFRMLSQRNLMATKLLKDSVFIDINKISYSFSFNYALPVLGSSFIGARKNVLYSCIDARFMFEAFNQTGLMSRIDEIKDSNLSNYFKSANIHSNPIISMITFK